MYSPLSGPTDGILRYIKTTFTFLLPSTPLGRIQGHEQGGLIGRENMDVSPEMFAI